MAAPTLVRTRVGAPRRRGDAPRARRPQRRRQNLEAAALRWWTAFDAAETALRAAGDVLPSGELRERAGRLDEERGDTRSLFASVAKGAGRPSRFPLLLVPRGGLRHVLGLPATAHACVFNLDGVLIGSEALHVAAWTETLDALILARIERTGGSFAPFNPSVDYHAHMHARPRFEGLRGFLASRGISLPEGTAADPPGAETVHGVASRKRQVLLRLLDERGIDPLDGAFSYLGAARRLGLRCAAVSASATTGAILGRAGLDELVEASVDGRTVLSERLRANPAPDMLLAACRRLGVDPAAAAAFETTAAGVAAAKAAGFAYVVGVDPTGRAALRRCGADVVVRSLNDLLERNLTGPGSGVRAVS